MNERIEQVNDGYLVDGKYFPRVSHITSILKNFSRIDPEILSIKQKWGTALHEYFFLHDCGELDLSEADERVLPIIQVWEKAKQGLSLGKIVLSEKCLYSRRYGYVGTPDRLFEGSDGKFDLIDIKTTAKPDRTTGPQLAAYTNLIVENKIARLSDIRMIEVCLNDNDYDYQVHEYADNWRIFMCCLSIHQFLRR